MANPAACLLCGADVALGSAGIAVHFSHSMHSTASNGREHEAKFSHYSLLCGCCPVVLCPGYYVFTGDMFNLCMLCHK
jgi:hypothetical protein